MSGPGRGQSLGTDNAGRQVASEVDTNTHEDEWMHQVRVNSLRAVILPFTHLVISWDQKHHQWS